MDLSTVTSVITNVNKLLQKQQEKLFFVKIKMGFIFNINPGCNFMPLSCLNKLALVTL